MLKDVDQSGVCLGLLVSHTGRANNIRHVQRPIMLGLSQGAALSVLYMDCTQSIVLLSSSQSGKMSVGLQQLSTAKFGNTEKVMCANGMCAPCISDEVASVCMLNSSSLCLAKIHLICFTYTILPSWVLLSTKHFTH